MTDGQHENPEPVTRHIDCDEIGLDEQFGVWTLGFGRTDSSGDIAEYVTLQSPGEGDDDWGPYFEVDDQLHGGYRVICEIAFTDGRIEFGLNKGLGPDKASRIVVTYADTRENRSVVSQGLDLVFGDQLDGLITQNRRPQS